MNNIFKSTLITIATSSVLLSGCTSQSVRPMSGDEPAAHEVRHNVGMSALKGCGLGAIPGLLMGIAGKNPLAMRVALGGCVIAGSATGFLAYRSEVNKAKDLEAQARSQGLQPVLTTVQVQTKDSKEPVDAMDKLVLPLNAQDVRAHGERTRGLLLKASDIVNSDTSGRRITILLTGPAQDRDWMRSVIQNVIKDSDRIADKYATTPGIELSPVPQVAGAK